jgi:hypothetical protein
MNNEQDAFCDLPGRTFYFPCYHDCLMPPTVRDGLNYYQELLFIEVSNLGMRIAERPQSSKEAAELKALMFETINRVGIILLRPPPCTRRLMQGIADYDIPPEPRRVPPGDLDSPGQTLPQGPR